MTQIHVFAGSPFPVRAIRSALMKQCISIVVRDRVAMVILVIMAGNHIAVITVHKANVMLIVMMVVCGLFFPIQPSVRVRKMDFIRLGLFPPPPHGGLDNLSDSYIIYTTY